MDINTMKNARMKRLSILREKRQNFAISEQERSNKQPRTPFSDVTNVGFDPKRASVPCQLASSSKNNDTGNTFYGFNSNSQCIQSLKAGKVSIQNGRVVPSIGIRRSECGDTLNREKNSTAASVVDTVQGGDTLTVNVSKGYWDIGDPTLTCEFCGALLWFEERAKKDRNSSAKFSLCCQQGKVQLPKLKEPPSTLWKLFRNRDSKSKHFLENIRAYNMMFSFTSMGGKVVSSGNTRRGPYVFKLHGQNYHMIGSLLPSQGSSPKSSQLYIYDTQNEVSNRMRALSSRGDANDFEAVVVDDLRRMLDENNALVKAFRSARDRFNTTENESVKLKLIGRRDSDGRTYNLPTASEVAALIVGDFESSTEERDIIVETKSGQLQRISELHPSYLALQYPLLFPYGEDGYRIGIPLRGSSENGSSKKRSKLSMREFFSFRLFERLDESSIILWSRKLWQQFLVDGFTMIESERLHYIRTHKKNLRVELYKNLTDAVRGDNSNSSSTGKRIVLPSSFTGGARYMIQNYQDAMAICKWYGYPDLFITFTCNPKWPEIMRFVEKRGLRPEDRPDILCRVFKIKLDEMVKDLRDKKIFGRVKAVIYTVEFQKRGLPHAHILLFLHPEDKYPTADDINKIISAEIPDSDSNPELHQLVKDFMIHGPWV